MLITTKPSTFLIFFPDISHCKGIFIGKVIRNIKQYTVDFAGIIVAEKQCLNNIYCYIKHCGRDEAIAT